MDIEKKLVISKENESKKILNQITMENLLNQQNNLPELSMLTYEMEMEAEELTLEMILEYVRSKGLNI